MLPLEPSARRFGIGQPQAALKRALDIAVSGLALALIGWLLLILIWLARRETGLPGLFTQKRLGLYGEPFTLYKIRTMRPLEGVDTVVSTARDPRITRMGAFLRRTKIDELPQLYNILRGDMSLVGPRPDVPETFEDLRGDALRIFTVRPGITGEATLAFRHEETLLAEKADPEAYNRDVVFPKKVAMNLGYLDGYRVTDDIRILFRTVASVLR